MTTQIAIGNLLCSDGSNIPLGPVSVTDSSTSQEVTSDPAFTITAQTVGDYAQGKTVVQGFVSAKTHAGWAYILRNGVVGALIPVCSRTGGGSGSVGDLPLCNPWTLRAGDKVLFYTEA
jgi:hypothetical protein